MGTLTDEDEEALEEAEPSPLARELAEWGAAISDVWKSRSLDVQIAERRRRRGACAELREVSQNRKLSPVDLDTSVDGIPRPHARPPFCSSTFAAISATCPDSCPFKGHGCMADGGFTRVTSIRLNRAAAGLTEIQVLAEEVVRIDGAFGGGAIPGDGAGGRRALRLHVGGDVLTEQGAMILGAAAVRWRRRGGGSVWTFTHSWRTVPRAAWGWAVSVLASVETVEDLELALERGYAPAIVVPELPANGRRFTPEGARVPVIPCPAEARSATCVECRLCLDRPLVKMRVGIAFGVHGRDKAAARDALIKLGGPRR